MVASHRAKGYCDYLTGNGVFPTLITHRWEKDEYNNWKNHQFNDEIIYEYLDNCNIIRLPRPKENFHSYSSLITLKHWLTGDFDIHLLKSYKIFKKFLFCHLRGHHYDTVLAIFSPHYHLKLAQEIKRKFGIPYVLDFRDLWDNQVITSSYSPNFKKKIQDRFVKYFWRKWLNDSLFFSTTSEKWINFLENLSNSKGIKVRNGHQIESLPIAKSTSKFRIGYFGRIYPYQNTEVIIDGINKFLLNHSGIKDFEILLIGIKKVQDFDGSEIFRNKIDQRYIKELAYVPKNELYDFSRREISLFILPNLREDNGSFFVKLFDFISLNKPIILAPNNGSENDDIVIKTNSGLLTSSSTDIARYLEKLYSIYKESGKVCIAIDKMEFENLHRKRQVKILADEIKKY